MEKELNMAARKIVTKKLAQQYMKARKKERVMILDNLVKVAGYNRKYAGWYYIDRTNAFSYNGTIYRLNDKRNLVGRKVTLHIHPEKKIRVFPRSQF